MNVTVGLESQGATNKHALLVSLEEVRGLGNCPYFLSSPPEWRNIYRDRAQE